MNLVKYVNDRIKVDELNNSIAKWSESKFLCLPFYLICVSCCEEEDGPVL